MNKPIQNNNNIILFSFETLFRIAGILMRSMLRGPRNHFSPFYCIIRSHFNITIVVVVAAF